MKNARKITSILVVASMTIVMFGGCSSKKADTAVPSSSTTQAATTAKTDNKKFDPTAMKVLYADTLKALVTDSTITQAQSDKVLEAITKDMPQGTDKPAGTPPTGTDKPSENPPAGTDKPKEGKNPNDDKLSALVTSKVITQAQADTINKKIGEAMKSSSTKQ